jgi:threonine/homoserine/homoserine lactone efflux protein
MLSNLVTFAILAGILVLIPGLDFAVVLRYSATQSRRASFLVSLGITSGLYIWGLAAVIGVAAILKTSAAAFQVLKVVGAIYLFWMGSRFVLTSFKNKGDAPNIEISQKQNPYLRGLLSNILNPKPAVFYLSIFPQFIPIDSNHFLVGTLLTTIHAAESMIFFTLLILFVGKLKPFFAKPAVAKYMERLSGFAIIGFGTRLLLESASN